MKYSDFKKDTPYRVVSGENDQFDNGDLFWIDSINGFLNVAGIYGGWLEDDEIEDWMFENLVIAEDNDYIVITIQNKESKLVHKSMVKINGDNI